MHGHGEKRERRAEEKAGIPPTQKGITSRYRGQEHGEKVVEEAWQRTPTNLKCAGAGEVGKRDRRCSGRCAGKVVCRQGKEGK